MTDTYDTPMAVQRLSLPITVIDGIDVIVPEAPLGQAAIAVRAALVEMTIIKVPFINLAADSKIVNIGGAYMGHSLKEAQGNATAEVDFFDGGDATGILFNPVTLQPNESTRDWYPLPGIPIEGGVFAHIVSGRVTGCIYFGVAPDRTAEAVGG